ncbi:MAG: hypothetical protein METHAR1v1_1530002 [Methanothrix sp.]|nr:MAG: hypothetical protein METHAR1v1_1530002 [Methanothrix sp.]
MVSVGLTLEDRGIKVGVIDLAGGGGFYAFTLFAEDDGRAPVVVGMSDLLGDRGLWEPIPRR